LLEKRIVGILQGHLQDWLNIYIIMYWSTMSTFKI
jgi:hypothetical protein